jgi:hypothetical protein
MDETTSLQMAIGLGTRVRLKNGTLKDVKIRQWEFSGLENGKIVLYRREGLILEVGSEDIDWEGAKEGMVED